jgi:hypothetical protein
VTSNTLQKHRGRRLPECEDGSMAEEALAVIELQSSCLEGLMFIKGPKVRVTIAIDSR